MRERESERERDEYVLCVMCEGTTRGMLIVLKTIEIIQLLKNNKLYKQTSQFNDVLIMMF